MLPLGGISLVWLSAGFVVAAGVIALAGTRLAAVADRLADRTGMGQVLAGALFVGASTSLPGLVTTVVAAMEGRAALAVGNAVGGLTAQTLFIVLADFAYRRSNLEHAAASAPALAQGVLLIVLLCVPLTAVTLPPLSLGPVHPASLVLVGSYVAGLVLLGRIRDRPMWRPVRLSGEAAEEEPRDDDPGQSTGALWGWFALCTAAVALAGYTIAETGMEVADRTALSDTAVGTLLTAIATSLPELVTAVAAVRRGATGLAVGDIIGGNCFDLLFLALADAVYPGPSIYHAFSRENLFVTQLTVLMTAVLLLGMIRRQRLGMARIGFEGVVILVLYALSVLVLVLAPDTLENRPF